jgi:D-arabinose 5-phosphate isomerase GutQ
MRPTTEEQLMQTKQGLQKSAKRDLGILMALTNIPGSSIQKSGSTTLEIPGKEDKDPEQDIRRLFLFFSQ